MTRAHRWAALAVLAVLGVTGIVALYALLNRAAAGSGPDGVAGSLPASPSGAP